MANEELLAKLSAAIERLSSGQAAAAQPTLGCGLPQPMAIGAPMGVPAAQPTGVSVPVTIPLPDGREISARVHFGPEVAANLQAAGAMAAQMFGPYLQARQPYRGWQGGGYAPYSHYSNGRGSRRW